MNNIFYKNAIVTNGTETLRVITADAEQNRAAVIDLAAKRAQPRICALTDLKDYTKHVPPSGGKLLTSPADNTVGDRAWNAIESVVVGGNVYKLCDPSYRAAAVREAAAKAQLSDNSIYKYLRRYFQRGQDRMALMGNFARCGARNVRGTVFRGRKSRYYETFQLTAEDQENMRRVIEDYYKVDERRSLHDTWLQLITDHYCYLDGNGESHQKAPGQRPSERQLRHYLKTNFEIGEVIKARVGEKEYERNHRASISTAVKHCLGVGHLYDIDATILDLFAVFDGDRTRIIGKPTLYLIVDRKSRLIVGFSLTLENASYMAAVEAIASIAQDKQALCEWLGLPYDPNDWPADQIFPMEFIADRAEMLSKAASALGNRMTINVGLTEALRPELKSFGENGFKLLKTTMLAEVPAFDPPENALRRRKKGYEKDACLTVREIFAIIVWHIITLNRRTLRKYPLTPAQVLNGQEPSPIALWNEGISKHLGQLPRYTADEARRRLWPIGEASLTEDGLEFQHCVYSCEDRRFPIWAAEARRSGARRIPVLYNRSVVDRVYLEDPRSGELLEATLSDRNPEGYEGLSFAEVGALHRIQTGTWTLKHGETRLKVELDRKRDTAAIAEPRLKEHKARGVMSRKYRKADTKADRTTQLHAERERTGLISDAERLMSQQGHPANDGSYIHQVATDLAGPHQAGTRCDEASVSPTALAVTTLYSEMRITK
jgi:putative transposase